MIDCSGIGDLNEINAVLNVRGAGESAAVGEILAKARALKGLSDKDAAVLMAIQDPALLHDLHATARWVKQAIYGSRIVLFAPLYISNLCSNECLYCAFRRANQALERKALSREEIQREIEAIIAQGHKRVLLVAGEKAGAPYGLDYVIDSVRAIYETKAGHGEVRRVNVNIAPLTVDEFRRLKEERIGTYQLFQETYHEPAYAKFHVGGPKRDYRWRLEAMDRAMEAGIGDVGIGPLLGLADWRFETLATLRHARHLEEKFGVGPHTISVPRIEPALGSEVAEHVPAPVSDEDFLKIIAILRLAVPYTGIILSTRETPALRAKAIALGVSQISAGSRTNPGGYTGQDPVNGQFQVGDLRPLDEVIRELIGMEYIPSFCTGCYRMGRVGRDFMDLAKPGAIKTHCDPNGLSTFQEYLCDYASPGTREAGEKLIKTLLPRLPTTIRRRCAGMLEAVRSGQRDVFV